VVEDITVVRFAGGGCKQYIQTAIKRVLLLDAIQAGELVEGNGCDGIESGRV